MKPRATLPHRLVGPLLGVLVPIVALVSLELLTRGLNLEEKVSRRYGQNTPQVLEMPTWMLREDNVRARASVRASLDPDALEWMNLFHEGEGFRVSLFPHLDVSVRNTFSRLPQDLERRYHVQTNSLGFRGPELTQQKPAGTFRVLVFGDSSSFGWGVDQDQMYSSLLSRELAAIDHSSIRPDITTVEVGNFAIPGDSSEYGSLLFERFAPSFSPDLVILGFGANDAKKVVTPHQVQVQRFREGAWLSTARTLLQRSAFVRTITQLLNPKTAPLPTPLSTAVERKRYRANLVRMGEQSKAIGARTLLLSLCTPAQYRRSAAAVAQRKGYLYLDGQDLLLKSIPLLKSGELYPQEANEMQQTLGPLLSEEPLLYVSSDGCHPNALGHEIIAQALIDLIRAAPRDGSPLISAR